MVIKLNNIVLCAGSAAGSPGDPTGPEGLNMRLSPGTEDYEYLNAPGVDTEHVGCDRKAVSFGVARTYDIEAAAQAAEVTLMASAPRAGELAIDGKAVIAKGTLRDLDIRQIGCTLLIRYSVEGF